MAVLFRDFAWLLTALALAGTLYALLAAWLVGRFMARRDPAPAPAVAVTILKPLYLDEPGLRQNLESFFNQDYPAPVQIVFGVRDADDPAAAVVRALQADYPRSDTVIVADGALRGANAKISNLINMLPAACHDLLVLSDSDITVPKNWLRQVTAALARPGVGAVTCLYTGETAKGEKRLWPMLSAMGTSYGFLPNVVTGRALALAQPCMGSTIALSRAMLERIGGFAPFANVLADDYEMGRAVRALGHAVAVPALGVGHTAGEASARELIRHELRWSRTIRRIDPMGHLGSIVTFPLPLALVAAILLGFSPASLAVPGAALLARLFLKRRIDASFGTYAGPLWLLPARDLLGFAIFVTSLLGETVHWRGNRFQVRAGGTISPQQIL